MAPRFNFIVSYSSTFLAIETKSLISYSPNWSKLVKCLVNSTRLYCASTPRQKLGFYNQKSKK